ncbi:hypothetical protein SAMN05192543_11379 [Paraburkholderia megapolitana]|uniref:Uncharacterized protein n=1 Tax=Paraburkholderia megapolitana TaxID=420953 RepID=A0A1I3V8L4_9BURK|nr:hypothetical protein SAMN05192543_11379 [Paraburkholderia megapolitana]
MADEHASNGVAAACPTTGMIFSVADAARHGNAARPQPLSGSNAAHTADHAVTRATHRRVVDLVTFVTQCSASRSGVDVTTDQTGRQRRLRSRSRASGFGRGLRVAGGGCCRGAGSFAGCGRASRRRKSWTMRANGAGHDEPREMNRIYRSTHYRLRTDAINGGARSIFALQAPAQWAKQRALFHGAYCALRSRSKTFAGRVLISRNPTPSRCNARRTALT